MILYKILIPTKAPANNAIMKIHPETEREAVAIKKELILQPPAMHMP